MFHEFICLLAAENVVAYYRARAKSTNWHEWVHSNPEAAAVLAEIEQKMES